MSQHLEKQHTRSTDKVCGMDSETNYIFGLPLLPAAGFKLRSPLSLALTRRC